MTLVMIRLKVIVLLIRLLIILNWQWKCKTRERKTLSKKDGVFQKKFGYIKTLLYLCINNQSHKVKPMIMGIRLYERFILW